jgi:hypothetical protein
LLLINLPKLFFFYKLNIKILEKKWFFEKISLCLIFFLKYFFNFNITKHFLRLDSKIWSYYTNNLTKSFIFWKFLLTYYFFRKPNMFAHSFKIENVWNFNSSLLLIRTSQQFLLRKPYKNIFFFFLYYVMSSWTQLNLTFKFNLNYLLLSNNFFLFKFYNGPFFKIYNF